MIPPDEREFTVRFTTRTVTFKARVRDRGALARMVRTRQVIKARVRSGRYHQHISYLNLALVEEIL